MFELKRLSLEAVPAALERALRYRLLNEPAEAESICHDVLEIDPENQEALVMLLLATICDPNLVADLNEKSATLAASWPSRMEARSSGRSLSSGRWSTNSWSFRLWSGPLQRKV